MILSRLQHRTLIEYIEWLHKEDVDTAYETLLNFLQQVTDYCFDQPESHTAKTQFLYQSTNSNHYQKIKSAIKQLKHFSNESESNAKKLAHAFAIAYGHSKDIFESINKEQIDNDKGQVNDEEQIDGDVSLEEFYYDMSKIFTFGLFEELSKRCDRINLDKTGMTASAIAITDSAIDQAKCGRLYDFVLNAMQIIERIEKLNYEEANDDAAGSAEIIDDAAGSAEIVDDGSEVQNRRRLLEAFTLAVNQAIDLLADYKKVVESRAQEAKKYQVEVKETIKGKEIVNSLSAESGTSEAYMFEQAKAVVRDADRCFSTHIQCQLAKIEVLKVNTASLHNHYIRDVYKTCNAYINDKKNKNSDQYESVLAIRNDILSYYTPTSSPTFIINPAFSLAPKPLEIKPQHRFLLDELAIDSIGHIDKITIELKKFIESYERNRGGFFNWARDAYRNKSASHPSGKNQRLDAAQNLVSAFDAYNPEKGRNGVVDLAALLYSCNISMYGDDTNDKNDDSQGYKHNKHAIASGYHIRERSSNLKATIVQTIKFIRTMVDAHHREFECLLAANSNVTKHDFYFELNLSVNKQIKAKYKEAYNGKMNAWWRKALDWLPFRDGDIRSNKKLHLNNLLKELVACKTEENYVAFFYDALNLSASYHSDSDYQTVIRNICVDIVKTHLLGDEKFKLNFNSEQLRLIMKILRVLHMQDDTVYIKLNGVLTEMEREEANRLQNEDISSISKDNKYTKNSDQKQEIGMANTKQIKLDRFKTILSSKLESNLLADMVIGTGRFVLKDRDIGLLGQGLSLIVANAQVPGAAGLGAAIKVATHSIDDMRQTYHGSETGKKLSSYKGAFSLWWNDIALSALDKLTTMFAEEISRMHDSDVDNFAEFCYMRMYNALLHNDRNLSNDLDMVDYLVASVFASNMKMNYIPGRKDHYRREGDTSWFPKTTFQGLVDNVGFVCDEYQIPLVKNVSENKSDTKNKDTKNKDTKNKERVKEDEVVKNKNDSGTHNRILYLMRSSLLVKGEAENRRSGFAKYGVVHSDDNKLAQKLGRKRFFQDTAMLDKIPVDAELQEEIDLVHGEKRKQKQNDLISAVVVSRRH